MSKTIITLFLLAIALFCSSQNKIKISDDIYLIWLTDSICIHESWHFHESYGKFPSNGLIVIKDGEALLIDTPYDTVKTKILYKFLQDSLHTKITHTIACHFHDDCLGGLPYLHEKEVETIGLTKTIELCKENNITAPQRAFSDSLILSFNNKKIEIRYFGEGHTKDNIVVFVPDENILFGGCLVKSLQSTNLGNISDASVLMWEQTIRTIKEYYPDIHTVVPGHGSYGNIELLNHTLDLIKHETTK